MTSYALDPSIPIDRILVSIPTRSCQTIRAYGPSYSRPAAARGTAAFMMSIGLWRSSKPVW